MMLSGNPVKQPPKWKPMPFMCGAALTNGSSDEWLE
eukprot:CAMPEP_0115325744 /NCGR_PEP_ID=MMETSP0270-20121206/83182_1 /TAXON_ID=71861 /ORGANISM="Scrippsiella trochoidea, Strain CCMP3099" /LENGTH=35 /DNA_ID= /DNA_START= /DNA_END= /DNA_ORIENTATION=